MVESAESGDASADERRLELKPAGSMDDTRGRMSVSFPTSIREIVLQPQSSSYHGQSIRVVMAGETIAQFPKTQPSPSEKMAPRSAFDSIKPTNGKSSYFNNPFCPPINPAAEMYPAAEMSPDSILDSSRGFGSINNAPINLSESMKKSKPNYVSSKSSSGPPIVLWDPIPVREQVQRSMVPADSPISLLNLDTTITQLPAFAPSPTRNVQAQILVEQAELIESSNPAIGSRRVHARPSASTLVLFDN